MKHRKTQLAAAVGAALLLGAGAVQAQNLQVQLYGQVNRALMHADNDAQNKWFVVDNQMSSSRIGVQGTSEIAPGLRAGGRIETEIRSNRSNEVNFVSPTNGSAQGFTERWIDAFVEGGWGRVNLGQGSGAADDASTIDLSGTSQVAGATLTDLGGVIPFASGGVTSIGTGAFATQTIAPINVADNLDFESRYDRVMYTTPVFGGFRAQAGWGQKDNAGEATEASIWYSGKLAGDLQAAIGWSKVKLQGTAIPATSVFLSGGVAGTASQDRETMGGSISWLHTSGFNVTLQYTQRDLESTVAREAKHYFAKVGYKFGTHAISLAYEMGKDQAFDGSEGTVYNLAYVWNPIRWAEFYAAYQIFMLDDFTVGAPISATPLAVSPEDIKVFVVGTRIRF